MVYGGWYKVECGSGRAWAQLWPTPSNILYVIRMQVFAAHNDHVFDAARQVEHTALHKAQVSSPDMPVTIWRVRYERFAHLCCHIWQAPVAMGGRFTTHPHFANATVGEQSVRLRMHDLAAGVLSRRESTGGW